MDSEFSGKSSQNKLLLYTVCILLVIRIIVVNLVNYFLSPTPIIVVLIIDYLEFLIISIYLLSKPDYLYSINLDKITFVLFTFTEVLAHIPTSPNLWEVILFVLFVITAGFLLVRFLARKNLKPHFAEAPVSLILVGIIVGVFVFMVLKMLPFFLFSGTSYRFLYPMADSIVMFLSAFIFQLGRAVIFEEILFRGMIVGFTRSMGWTGTRIIILQTLLFWIAHMTRGWNTYLFFIELPIIGIVLGFLALKTKSVLPGIIVHGIFNSLFLILAAV